MTEGERIIVLTRTLKEAVLDLELYQEDLTYRYPDTHSSYVRRVVELRDRLQNALDSDKPPKSVFTRQEMVDILRRTVLPLSTLLGIVSRRKITPDSQEFYVGFMDEMVLCLGGGGSAESAKSTIHAVAYGILRHVEKERASTTKAEQ